MLTPRTRRRAGVRHGWVLVASVRAAAVVPVATALPASAQKASGEPILLGNVALYSQPGFNGQPVGKLALQAWQLTRGLTVSCSSARWS